MLVVSLPEENSVRSLSLLPFAEVSNTSTVSLFCLVLQLIRISIREPVK